MKLVDFLEKQDIEQIDQAMHGWIDHLKQIASVFRDESEVLIEIPGPIRIHFKRKEKSS